MAKKHVPIHLFDYEKDSVDISEKQSTLQNNILYNIFRHSNFQHILEIFPLKILKIHHLFLEKGNSRMHNNAVHNGQKDHKWYSCRNSCFEARSLKKHINELHY